MGSLRLGPGARISFEAFPPRLLWRFLELLFRASPENRRFAVIRDGMAAQFYLPGTPEAEGVEQLASGVDSTLSLLLSPPPYP